MKPKRISSSYCAAVALLALLPLVSDGADAAADTKDPTSDQETHVLFTGTDIRILYQGAVHPVQGVDGTSLVINFKDKGIGLPIGDNAKKIVVAQTLMLADRSATVTNFKHERVYTAANDPFRKWSGGMMKTQAMQEHAAFAEANARGIEPLREETDRMGNKTGKMVANEAYAPAQAEIQATAQSAGGNMGSTDYYLNEMTKEMEQELFDALNVQFEISSEHPIQDAYVVLMAKYHAKDDPKESHDWMYAKSIGRIDSTPRKVSLREGGLTPGFVLEKLNVHLYENGVEIATDLSENRAALTRDEAHEYLVIEHVSAHKTDTLPARIALTKLPEDWATHPRDESFRKTYYVQVDKEGRPLGAFEDEDCTTRVANAYCEAVLLDQLFFPALSKGNPVDSVVRVKLSKLSK